jgi:hypothetical protein
MVQRSMVPQVLTSSSETDILPVRGVPPVHPAAASPCNVQNLPESSCEAAKPLKNLPLGMTTRTPHTFATVLNLRYTTAYKQGFGHIAIQTSAGYKAMEEFP